MKKIIFSIVLLVSALYSHAQVPAVAGTQTKAIALMNGVAHIGDGKVIENSIITFDKGKITLVADARAAKVDLSAYEVINIEGKHVYPGFILPNTDLGLIEVDAVPATDDKQERGGLNASIRSIIAYNTDSELIPTMRFNGILTAQVTPQGGLISGNSSIVQLDAWNWEDAALKMDDGLHMNWPRLSFGPRWWMGETKRRPNPNYDKTIQAMKQLFQDSKAYAPGTSSPNLKLEGVKGIFDGSKQLFLHVRDAKEIIASVSFAKEQGVKSIVLVGARDAYAVADFIKEHDIPVILGNVHSLPSRVEEDIDMPYKLPYLLSQKGIKVGLSYGGTNNARNLAFFAGTAVAYGMEKEAALRMITSNTAEILKMDASLGSLKEGLDATLFVSDGDALDMRGNLINQLFIQGRKVHKDAMQQRLFKKYSDKYEH